MSRDHAGRAYLAQLVDHVFFVAPAINLNPRTARLLLSEYQVAFLTLIEARFWLLKAIFGITGPFVLQHILQQIGPA